MRCRTDPRLWQAGGGYDAATIQYPTFIYHGKKDAETPAVNAELHQTLIGLGLILVPESSRFSGHTICSGEEIILAL